MNLEIIKELQIESANTSFNYTGTLYNVGDSLHIKKIDTEGNEKVTNLKLGDLVNLYLVIKDFIEKHPEVKKFEKPRVELKGSINYDKDTDTVVMKSINAEYSMDLEDLEKIHYMLTLATPELKTVQEYVNDIKEFIDKQKIRMKEETGYNFQYVDPNFELFDEWFLDWSGLFELSKDRYRFSRIPDSWMMKFADKVQRVLLEEFGSNSYGCRNYNGDHKYIELMGARSIFFVPFDEFGCSPYRTVADRYTSELQNDVLGDRIPSSGQSKDMAAELVSNLNYTLYRWYNDGDVAEDLIHHPNAIVMANILQYINDMGIYNSMIFYHFYMKSMRMIWESHKIAADTCPTLSDLEKYIEENPPKNGTPGYYHGYRLPDEISKKIDDGTFTEEDAENYRYDSEYRFDPEQYFEFILSEAVPYLITIMLILKKYPDWLKECKVKSLRSRYLKANSDYDW